MIPSGEERLIEFLVPWDIRLFFIFSGLVHIAIGWTWIKGGIRHRSRYGLRFRMALASEEIWRELHRRAGFVILSVGVLWLLPLPGLRETLLIQIPIGAGVLMGGILLVKFLLERREKMRAARSYSDRSDAAPPPAEDGTRLL